MAFAGTPHVSFHTVQSDVLRGNHKGGVHIPALQAGSVSVGTKAIVDVTNAATPTPDQILKSFFIATPTANTTFTLPGAQTVHDYMTASETAGGLNMQVNVGTCFEFLIYNGTNFSCVVTPNAAGDETVLGNPDCVRTVIRITYIFTAVGDAATANVFCDLSVPLP